MVEDATGWRRLDLYGDRVAVWRHAESGRFRVALPDGARVEFGRDNVDALESLLLALADAKRDISGEDFVPGKSLAAPARREDPNVVPVRFEPEDLEYLRARVRVGKEDSLDDAVARAVKTYLRDLLARADATAAAGLAEEDDHHRRARAPRRHQRRLDAGEPQSLAGIGAIQRSLLQTAASRGHITRLDVGRAYGITASRRGASSARQKAEAHVNALVSRGLLRQEMRGPDVVWVLTETGRALVETDM